MTTVREISDPAELECLGPVWNDLLESTPGASFFHSLAWLQVYWKHFGARKRLRVLVVEEGQAIIGILPLVVRRARRSEPFRALTHPLDGWGSFYGPIGPDPLTTLVAGLNYVRRAPRDWDIIELEFVDALVDNQHTQKALARAGLEASCETQDTSAIVELAPHGSWDGYLTTRKKSWRKDLRKKESRLAERGAVSYVRHRTNPTEGSHEEPRWDLYDACVNISKASWQGKSRAGTSLNNRSAFYRDCFAAASRFGAIDVGLLLIDGIPVAYQYAYQYRGHISALKTGYDPGVAFEGAGTIVQARTIADSIARGDQLLDLGGGSLEYKRNWLTDERPIYRYTHFPRASLAAQLIRIKRTIERWWHIRPMVLSPK